MKGTIQSTEALMSAFTILIPVPVKGTICIFLFKKPRIAALIPVSMLRFNPRAHEGHDPCGCSDTFPRVVF